MGSHMKKSSSGSIHRIREFELEKVNLAEEFDILQIVGEGWFGKILLVEHRATDTEMVLKALPKAYTSLRDFYREFHYGLHLGVHKHIITTYDVAFETAGFYVFSQEYAPLGDLTSNVTENGIGELHTKRVAKQLTSALEHLHARDLVHRDVKLDNILIFKSDFTRIKLCDFGETRRSGTIVRRCNEWLPYAPPEVLQIGTDEAYKTVTSHDVWQFGIVIFVCLTGCLPWQKAAPDDPRFVKYLTWHSSTLSPIRRIPKLFKLVSSRAQRLFRKLLETKPDRRPATLSEVHRYLDDRWMAKSSTEKNAGVEEDDDLCPSMYSFHSSPEEKNKLLHSLIQYGLETTVDREAKKDRIRAWIQNSVIEEEDEGAEEQREVNNMSLLSEEEEEENIVLHDNETGPVGERMQNRGPIGERRLSNTKSVTRSMVQDTSKISPIPTPQIAPIAPPRRHHDRHHVQKVEKVYSPPIDPTIPLAQQKLAYTNKNANNIQRPLIRNPNAFLSETNLPSISQDPSYNHQKNTHNISTNSLISLPAANYPTNLNQIISVKNSNQNSIQNQTLENNMDQQFKQDFKPESSVKNSINSSENAAANSTNTSLEKVNQNNITPDNQTSENKQKNESVNQEVPQNTNNQQLTNEQKNHKNSPEKESSRSQIKNVPNSKPISHNHYNNNSTHKKSETELEKDRNFNVYGIASKNIINKKSKSTIASSPKAKNMKSEKRRVTFKTSPPNSTKS